jgi:hypothetical protein
MPDAVANLSWTNLPGSGDGVLVTIDLGASHAVCGLELTDADLSGGFLAAAIAADWSADGIAWSEFPDVISLGGQAQTRRIMAPPGVPVAARHVRLKQKTPSQSAARDLTIAALRILKEEAPGGAKVVPFTFDDDAAYVLIYGAQNAEVYAGGVRMASVSSPYTEGSLLRLDFAQRLDTQLVFHENYPPWRIFRLGADTDWDGRLQVFDSMLTIEFEDTVYTNGVNEVQQLEFFEYAAGETFNITLDGETTGSIAYSATGATLAASIKAALEALPVLAGGTVTVANPSAARFTVTFSGDAGQRDWPEMAPSVVSSANGIVTSATLTQGKAGGEDAISATRGWPRCGAFTDSRLVMGGLRSLPQTAIASKLGEYFAFASTNQRATDAFEFTIDTQDANGIRRIFASETVQLFTASGVHFLSGGALAADEPTERRKSGSLGIQLNLTPVELDGGTVYVQKGGRGVRELQYNDNTKRYTPVSLSVRAPSLIDRPVDIFVRKTGTNFEDEMLGLINWTGVIATFTSLREQNVAAWSRENVRGGMVLAGGADSLARLYLVTEREVGGELVRYVEIEDPSRTLDCSVLVELEDQSVITGLEHLEGREDVYVVGNGSWWGPLTVEDGEVDLEEEVTGEFEVGIWFDAWVVTLEPRFQTENGSLLDVKKRIVDVTVSVLNSTLPALAYRHGAKTQLFPFKDPRPEARQLDRPPLTEPLHTGTARIEGLKGWDRSVDVKIYRQTPGPLHIRSLKLGVQT